MWNGDQFIYTQNLLRVIAENYTTLYDGLPTLNGEITNPLGLAELKADFDNALSSIGYRKWEGIEGKGYSRLQRAVISDIMGKQFNYDRNKAYSKMKIFLNTGKRFLNGD